MTYRDYMTQHNESFAGCSYHVGKRVSYAELDGEVCALTIDGQCVLPTVENIRLAAEIANNDHALYKGWPDKHILNEGEFEHGCVCNKCPWFDGCQAMDEEVDA